MPDKILLDVCCGRWGWSKEFAKRGWKCIGIDLVRPFWIPKGCEFVQADILDIDEDWIKARHVLFGCASTPCEEFSVHSMKMFHANPPFPEMGLKLFRHVEHLLRSIPHVMENVRGAEKFIGSPVAKCGPFCLYGNAVPPLLPQGIKKGMQFKKGQRDKIGRWGSNSWQRKAATAEVATIPPELAACVADYAERLLEVRDV